MRRKWLILSIFFLISAATIPFIWIIVKPQYRSTAVLRVEPVVPRLIFESKDDNTGLYANYLNTEVGTIRSPKVLSRVLDRPRIQSTFWYREEGRKITGGQAPAQERLPEDLSVLPRPQTYFIDISMYTQKPEEAKLIVDAVADAYLQFNEETRNDERARALDTLRQERDALDLHIRGKIQQMHQEARRVGTIDTIELRSKWRTQLSELEARRNTLDLEIRTLSDKIESLTRSSGPASETQPADSPFFASDPEWRRLNLEAKAARNRLETARLQFGERSTRIRELKMVVAHAEAQLRDREQQIQEELERGGSTGQAIAAINDPKSLAELKRLREMELGYYDEMVDKLQKRVDEAGTVAMKVADYEQEINHLKDLYQEYQRRIEVLESEIKAPARVNIMSYGTPSSQPDRDRRFLFTAMALMGAMALGLSVGYLRVTTDRRIHELSEVSATSPGPFLGKLPRVHPGSLPPDLGGTEMVLRSPSRADRARYALMESIRMVRTSLLERVARTGEKVLLITSSQSESGKSSVAVLLARSLAMIGKRVLLVDGDLRRQTLAHRLSIETTHGLAEVLPGRVTDSEAIDGSHHLAFDVIAAGDIPEDFDLELLSNGAFSGCVQRWRRMYDFVVLDSPPVLPVADARILAGHADGAIMVVRAGHDTRPDTVEAFSLLGAAGGKLLGTVFIGGPSERDYEYGKAYGYGYDSAYGFGSPGSKSGKGGDAATPRESLA